MVWLCRNVSAVRRIAVLASILVLCGSVGNSAARAAEFYARVGERLPAARIGWVQFCQTYRAECDTAALPPRDVVLDGEAWNELRRVNDRANHTIKPMTDMDHYGMIQWWRYPDDGAGACHSFALAKRRMLMRAGWPRQA